ncbi:hypothetical protein Lalb_Chr21g0312961 [Lupinus albus]|uniref:Uncharacterized protein n=1 Tax=Lupinus albus TaxID=3870 RepID=A0A6A4NR17_LUPAL|nr:hypothetical protein Lalb_Chr21g0312961 [Lupinus albus]
MCYNMDIVIISQQLVNHFCAFLCWMEKDAFVLCRVFHKNNIGPPNGQRYAPFVEEEWDDESGLVPGEESAEPISVVKQPSVNDNGRVLCIEGRKDVVQVCSLPVFSEVNLCP